MEFFKPGRVFDFMGQRVFWIPLSFILVFISTVCAFWPLPHVFPYGPNYGTDFRGGTEVEIAFKKQIDAANVRKAAPSTDKTAGSGPLAASVVCHVARIALFLVAEIIKAVMFPILFQP